MTLIGPTVVADTLAMTGLMAVLLTYMSTPFVAMDWIGGRR